MCMFGEILNIFIGGSRSILQETGPIWENDSLQERKQLMKTYLLTILAGLQS